MWAWKLEFNTMQTNDKLSAHLIVLNWDGITYIIIMLIKAIIICAKTLIFHYQFGGYACGNLGWIVAKNKY